jgi:5-methyltetrahydrofolate--homocysteine methyltransferase
MGDFLTALRSGRVLLMDGAMGTELQRAGIREGECYELWNLTHPDRVRAIHQANVDAGAEVLLTNTFQTFAATLLWPWPGGTVSPPIPYDEERWLIGAQWGAFALSRSACGERGFVLADIGPVVEKPSGKEFPDLRLLQKGIASVPPRVDGVLLETCSTPRVRWAVQTARQFSSKAVLLSLTYQRGEAGELQTRSGHPPEWFAERARHWGANALGVNCGRDIGMDEIIEIVRRYRQATDLPLFARPNAGTPARVGDRWVYPHTPSRMAARLPELLDAGVSMVGGCCGTTPEHIAAFRPIIDDWNARHDPPSNHAGRYA